MVLLSTDVYRGNFINNYAFFKTDGHINIYKDFIDNTNIHTRNDRIDDTIVLADNIGYCSKKLLSLVEQVLFSRKNFFLKLTCLDYLLGQNDKIDDVMYYTLNERYIHNKNEFLKLQANVNLLKTGDKVESKKHIIRVLKKAPYPSVFYRFFNSIEYNIDTFKDHIDAQFLEEVVQIAESKDFPLENKEEIKRIARGLMKYF
jgi:hypothetical protein